MILSGALFLLALPFAYLYDWLGPKLFWPVLFGIAAGAFVLWRRRGPNASTPTTDVPKAVVHWSPPPPPTPEQIAFEQRQQAKRDELQREAQVIRERRWRAEQRRRNTRYAEVPSPEGGVQLVINWPEQMQEVWNAWDEQDWEFVRLWLQKYAYALKSEGASDEQHADFKKLMVQLTQVDPLYHSLMALIQPAIIDEPGILQSALTKALAPHYKADDVRYALYFAAETGEIIRVKKGRSYQLYPAAAPTASTSIAPPLKPKPWTSR